MTPAEFCAKVEYEGGIVEALFYGLKASDIEPVTTADYKLETAWSHLEEVWAKYMAPAIDRVEAAFEAVEESA